MDWWGFYNDDLLIRYAQFIRFQQKQFNIVTKLIGSNIRCDSIAATTICHLSVGTDEMEQKLWGRTFFMEDSHIQKNCMTRTLEFRAAVLHKHHKINIYRLICTESTMCHA